MEKEGSKKIKKGKGDAIGIELRKDVL